ncbi:DNA-3-methyladenine glycosylase 2 family protein [Thermomonospora umbrina]|uniref:DNA-3-methyladenine glycosylase II n=1 Tax=Thermomonospora umbrina TaxID=111806 RepID=A0A3D9SV00_9ACTN|nr:DNA-3-methyladenine glycosylase 2 [Thermomonospora umbrina]REE98320.1 DNA-3-methyladenine glycosylase II [Thermomonospora umbrina]
MLDFDSCYRAVSARDARFDGRFFTGVTSTGIYCRPICPARTPTRRNVRFYQDAAAAEAAGFRPCKRCRPESSPGSARWDARGDLVRRGLRLIDDGVVDDHGVRGLAGRLSVTERHLHRLFVAELGAPPLAVARSRRLQLARRLLRETSMPVTDVAFAAGFGSVRQFNATLQETYGQTPSELRGPQPANGSVLALRLAVREPFDAAGLLDFLAARAIPGVEEVEGGRYVRAGPGPYRVELEPRDGHVLMRVDAADLRGVSRLVARCRRLLDLDAEPHAVHDVLGADGLLAPLVAARPGLRVPGAFDGFEMAVRAVLGQQVSVAAARTFAGRLVARCGEPLAQPTGTLTHRFPTAGAVAAADLSGLGLTGARERTLRALAEATASGDLDLGGGADPAETERRLLALPGVGPWTASYVAMRALGDPDAFPSGDLALRNAVRDLTGVETSAQDLVERAEAWRPWRAYAVMHLWASLGAGERTATAGVPGRR